MNRMSPIRPKAATPAAAPIVAFSHVGIPDPCVVAIDGVAVGILPVAVTMLVMLRASVKVAVAVLASEVKVVRMTEVTTAVLLHIAT